VAAAAVVAAISPMAEPVQSVVTEHLVSFLLNIKHRYIREPKVKTYARIENGTVVEILVTSESISSLFHPSLHWVDVTGQAVRVGWMQGADGTFTLPPLPPPAATVLLSPSLTDLLAEIAALKVQVAQLHTS